MSCNDGTPRSNDPELIRILSKPELHAVIWYGRYRESVSFATEMLGIMDSLIERSRALREDMLEVRGHLDRCIKNARLSAYEYAKIIYETHESDAEEVKEWCDDDAKNHRDSIRGCRGEAESGEEVGGTASPKRDR